MILTQDEKLARKIVCQHCGREIYVPVVVLWDGKTHQEREGLFYCPYCGQYTRTDNAKD